MEIKVTQAPRVTSTGLAKIFPEERVSVKALAQQPYTLLIDGFKYTGGELFQGKRITLKREGRHLVFELGDETFAQIEDFYGTDGASLDGVGWQYSNLESLTISGDSLVVSSQAAIQAQVAPIAAAAGSSMGLGASSWALCHWPLWVAVAVVVATTMVPLAACRPRHKLWPKLTAMPAVLRVPRLPRKTT